LFCHELGEVREHNRSDRACGGSATSGTRKWNWSRHCENWIETLEKLMETELAMLTDDEEGRRKEKRSDEWGAF
jgi:hypothetical protein